MLETNIKTGKFEAILYKDGLINGVNAVSYELKMAHYISPVVSVFCNKDDGKINVYFYHTLRISSGDFADLSRLISVCVDRLKEMA